VTFRIDRRPYLDPDVQSLVAEVQQEYVVRYGGPDRACVDPSDFDPPRGHFLVGLFDGDPVAIGGWRRIENDTTAEIKRMYVALRARRRGLARTMLAALEADAEADGITYLVLNTGTEQPEAVALYGSSGYLPVDAFGHYACAPRALFFGKALRQAAAGLQ
jgi:GNAT superfamily N-acetyltransferase